MISHLTPGCTCGHVPGAPCDATCPVHNPPAPAARCLGCEREADLDQWGKCASCDAEDGHPATWPCAWLVEHYTEDGVSARDCGAPAWETPTGWRCRDGHEHVRAEVRYAQGWEYAEDAEEARHMARNGVRPVRMDGTEWSL